MERHNHIPLKDRICVHCHASIEDEIHFAIECSFYDDLRYKMLKCLSDEFNDFNGLPILVQCNLLMNSKHMNIVASTICSMYDRHKLYS